MIGRTQAIRRLGATFHWGRYRSWRWLPSHTLNKLSKPEPGDTAIVREGKHEVPVTFAAATTKRCAGWYPSAYIRLSD